jgi:hypothetical protein
LNPLNWILPYIKEMIQQEEEAAMGTRQSSAFQRFNRCTIKSFELNILIKRMNAQTT